jgi:hypothetical protein
VYVVVAVGVTCRVPRAVTLPTPGSMLTAFGFSVSHVSTAGCPDRTDAVFAEKFTMRAGGTTRTGFAGAAAGPCAKSGSTQTMGRITRNNALIALLRYIRKKRIDSRTRNNAF